MKNDKQTKQGDADFKDSDNVLYYNWYNNNLSCFKLAVLFYSVLHFNVV